MTSPPAFRTCRAPPTARLELSQSRATTPGAPGGTAVAASALGPLLQAWPRVFDLDPRICDVVKSPPGIFLETTRQQTPDADRRIGRQRIPVWFGPDNGDDGVRDGLASES